MQGRQSHADNVGKVEPRRLCQESRTAQTILGKQSNANYVGKVEPHRLCSKGRVTQTLYGKQSHTDYVGKVEPSSQCWEGRATTHAMQGTQCHAEQGRYSHTDRQRRYSQADYVEKVDPHKLCRKCRATHNMYGRQNHTVSIGKVVPLSLGEGRATHTSREGRATQTGVVRATHTSCREDRTTRIIQRRQSHIDYIGKVEPYRLCREGRGTQTIQSR